VPGVLESAIAAEIEYLSKRLGAEGMSFETIVASGKRSALPHGRASNSPIPAQGFVVFDFGVMISGYCSDMTRTVHVGPPNRRAQSVYAAVLEAQLAGINAVKAGVETSEVDHAARNVLGKAGLSGYFTHSTGHGVGLEIHEIPGLRKKTKAVGTKKVKPDLLQPGMVITIEPGVYIPGWGGVRIEDMVLVTKTGCEVLTPTAKELVVL
jgi:Xaa-Pro aminopeptidase